MIVQPRITKNNLKIEGQQEYGRMMLDVFWYGFGVQLEKPGVGGVETAVAGGSRSAQGPVLSVSGTRGS